MVSAGSGSRQRRGRNPAEGPAGKLKKVEIMFSSTFARAAVIALAGAALLLPVARVAVAAPASSEANLVNKGVVELETGGSSETAARIAADIVSIVDDGATRRGVPVNGKGPIQNL